jgi:AcrR family transcriptional regulator
LLTEILEQSRAHTGTKSTGEEEAMAAVIRPEPAPGAPVEPDPPQRMLAGAIEAFAERGFHATTTRDIAARAGLSPAALYVHFPSKAALLAQISLVGHTAALELVLRAATEGSGPVERLRAVVSRFVAWHAENHRTARVVQYEFAALPDDARPAVVALRRQIERAVQDLITTGVDAGVMDVDQPRRVARAILSLSIDVARWYDPAGRDTAAELGALYADLAARMVGADPTGYVAGHSGGRTTLASEPLVP